MMNSFRLVIMILGILSLVLFQTTWALESNEQDVGELETIHNLGKIVVTAHEEEGARGIAIDPTATSIVIDTYKSSKSPQTVQDILESIPGVDIQRGDPALSDDKDVVKIRGMGARRILVRIDGRPVRNAGGTGDRMVDWNSLTIENVERVEVVRGAHSAIYGGAIGGTINIVTKKGGTRKDMKPEVKVMADYSAYDTQYYALNVAGNANALGYSLGGGYRTSDGYLRNSDYEIYDITGRVSYLFPFEGRLTLGYKGSFQDKSPFSVNDPDDPYAGHLYDSSYSVVPAEALGWFPNYLGSGGFNDKETEYFDLIFEQLTPVGDWKFHLYKSREYWDHRSYDHSTNDGFYEFTYDMTYADWGWIINDRFTLFDNHRITIGIEGREYEMGYNSVMLAMEWHAPKSKMIDHKAGYVEDLWQINDKLNFTFGLRYDRVELDVDVNFPGYDDFSKDIEEWSPKSRFTYEFLPGTTGFVHISKAYRLPTGMEISWMGAPTGLYIEPETAMEYESGILQDLGENNSIRLTYYYYDINNYVVFNRDPFPLLFAGKIEDCVFNADYLILQGIEAELNFQVFEQLSGYINYTYQDSELGDMQVPDEEVCNDHYQLPRHKAILGLDWSPWEDTTFITTLRYVDERKTSKNQEVDSFVTMDLGVEQCFLSKKLKLKGYVRNLFDEDYEEQYKIPAPERTFGINVSYIF
ncbi:MAG: TonB-dependent receptor [Desulfobacterales bacterium]|nr:TonB-dependent receptor [Desulfobacterales bacterium]